MSGVQGNKGRERGKDRKRERYRLKIEKWWRVRERVRESIECCAWPGEEECSFRQREGEMDWN